MIPAIQSMRPAALSLPTGSASTRRLTRVYRLEVTLGQRLDLRERPQLMRRTSAVLDRAYQGEPTGRGRKRT
jgi:hypothetical protein